MKSIERKRGDTYPITATLSNAAGIVDLTGATGITLGVSDKSHADAGGGSRLLELEGEAGEDPTDGTVKFDVTEEQALVLAPGLYSADVSFVVGGAVFTTPTFAFRVIGRIAPIPA